MMQYLWFVVISLSTILTPLLAQNPEAAGRTWFGGAEREGARRAIAWLEATQDLGSGVTGGGGWGSDAPRAILALQLANCSWIPTAGIKAELAATQLELQVALLLWRPRRHHEPPVSSGRLAQYTLALGAICKDPRDFHGRDLIGMLLHDEPDSDFEFAFVTLAVCSSGSHARKKHIRRLLDVAGDSAKHSADTLAMVVLALKCVAKEHQHRELEKYVAPPGMALAALQQPDGSFGNLHTTALAMQALQVANGITWDRGAAMNLLLSHQLPDGSFGDTFTTTEVALALQPRGLASTADCACAQPRVPSVSVADIEHDEMPRTNMNLIKPTHATTHGDQTELKINSTSPHNAQLLDVTYTLWAQRGSDPAGDLNVQQHFSVPQNFTFYHIMQVAAWADSRFVFEASLWPNGHYIHTIAKRKEDPSTRRYWLLYILPTLPDPQHSPTSGMLTPRGVDEMRVKDGDHFLFWYKQL